MSRRTWRPRNLEASNLLSPAIHPIPPKQANALLARLPEEQREVIMLKVYAGLTFKEIAETLELSANTVASRYRYAIERLREERGAAS